LPTKQIADVAVNLLKREKRNRETVSSGRNEVFTRVDAQGNEPRCVGEKPIVSFFICSDLLL
jgi:hypothetical protein